MNRKRISPKTSLKSGMSLLELTVVMASFLLILTTAMIGATALKNGEGDSGAGPTEEQAPKRVHMPALIA